MNHFNHLLYIDPGTGSMLFTAVLGISTALVFFVQKAWLRIKLFIAGGRDIKTDNTKCDYLIFTDSGRYWEMFRPICDEFEQRQVFLTYWTCDENDPGLNSNYSYINMEYIGNIYQAARRLNTLHADICITTTPGLDVYQWKRSPYTRYYIHLMHGVGDARCYKMFGLDSFDSVVIAGSHQYKQIRDIEGVRNLAPKDLPLLGEPHLDFLYERYINSTRTESTTYNVLLAPSWGKNAILSRYGKSIIQALLDTGYNITIRPHPQTKQSESKLLNDLIDQFPESSKLHWDNENDNFTALFNADIMISDFSSVIWEFCFIFDKPVIYADISFDPSVYDLAWVDEKRWDITALSKVGLPLTEDSFPHLKEMISTAIASDKLAQARHSLKDEAWSQGDSAKRITEYIIQKHDSAQ